MPMPSQAPRLAALLLPLAALAACVHAPGDAARTANAWGDARQLVLVTTENWDATQGELRRYERNGSGWRQVGPAAAISVGRTGTAWGRGLHPVQSDGPQ